VSVKGDLYRKLRTEAGKTQAEVAKALGVDHTTIAKIESGNRNLSHRLLPQLARVLGVAMARLVSLNDPPLSAQKIPKSDTWQPAEVAQFAFVMGDVEVGVGVRIGHFVVLDGTAGKVLVESGAVVPHLTRLTGPCVMHRDGTITEGGEGEGDES